MKEQKKKTDELRLKFSLWCEWNAPAFFPAPAYSARAIMPSTDRCLPLPPARPPGLDPAEEPASVKTPPAGRCRGEAGDDADAGEEGEGDVEGDNLPDCEGDASPPS